MTRTAYIVGGGPSLVGFDFSRLSGAFHVAVNKAYESCPEASVVYFLDPPFWEAHREALKAHPGRKIRGLVDGAEAETPGVEGHRLGLVSITNSGYAALRWCVEEGFERVYLLGFDASNLGGRRHFHDGYPGVPPKDSYDHWLAEWDRYRPGIEVLNASPESAIRAFPKVTLDEALGVLV